MDKIWKGQTKPSIYLSKGRTYEYIPTKVTYKDNYVKPRDYLLKDDQTSLFRDPELRKSLKNIDLNAKIDGLTNEITTLKEKLYDINQFNLNLRNKIREKSPNKTVTQRPNTFSVIHQNQFSPQQIPKYRQNENISSPPSHITVSFSYDKIKPICPQKLYNTREEVKVKEKQIEHLKEKSQQLESLVVTLENKLDKSNNADLSIVTKPKEYHRFYSQSRKENDRIKHPTMPSRDNKSIESVANKTTSQRSINIDDNYYNSKDQIDSLLNTNKIYVEEQRELKDHIEEMKNEINRLTSFKKENDKLVKELTRLKEDNAQYIQNLSNRNNMFATISSEHRDFRSGSKKKDSEYLNQITSLGKVKEQLLLDIKNLQSDIVVLEKKSVSGANELNEQKLKNSEAQEEIESLKKSLTLKDDALTHLNNSINKLEIEKSKLILDVEILTKDKQSDECRGDLTKLTKEKEELELKLHNAKIQLEIYELEQNEHLNEITKHKTENNTLNEAILYYKEELSKVLNDEQNQTSQQITDLRAQLNQFDEKYKNMLIEKEAEVKALTFNHADKDSEITELMKTIKQNNIELDELKGEIKEKELISERNAHLIDELTKANETLKSDPNKAKPNDDNKELELIQLSKIIGQLKDELKEKEDNMNTLTKANEEFLTEFNNKLLNKDKDIQISNDLLREKDAKINTLLEEREDTNKQLTEIINDKDNQLNQLSNENKEIHLQLMNLNTQIEEKEIESKKDDYPINQVLENYGITEEALSNLGNNLNEIIEYPPSIRSIDKVKIDNTILERRLRKCVLEVQELNSIKEKQLSLEHEIRAKDEHITALTSSLDNHQGISEMINNQIAVIDQLTKDKEMLQSDNNTLKNELTCECNNKEIQIKNNEDLFNQLAQLKESYSELEKKKTASEDILTKDKSDIEIKLVSAIETNDREKGDFIKKIEEMTRQLDTLKTMNENKNKDIADFKKSIEKKDLQINLLQRQNEEMSSDILQVQSKVTEAQNKLKKQQMINEQSEESTNNQLNQFKVFFNEKDEMIVLLQNKLSDLQKESEILQNEKEEHNQTIKDLNHQLTLKGEEIVDKEAEIAALNQNITNQSSLLNAQIQKLQQDQDDKDKIKKEINEVLDKKIEEYNNQQSLLENAKTALKRKEDEASQLLNEKISIDTNYNEANKQLKGQNDELLQQTRTLNEALVNKENIINQLQSDLETKVKEIINYQEVINANKLEISTYQSDLKQKENEISLLNQAAKDQETTMVKQGENKTRETNAEIDKLNIIINEKNSELEAYKRENELKDKDIITFNAQVNEKDLLINTISEALKQKDTEIKQLEQLKEEHENIKDSNEVLKHSLKEYEDKNKYKDNVIEEIQQQLNQLKEDNLGLSNQLTDIKIKDQSEKLLAENDELKTKIKEITQESSKQASELNVERDAQLNSYRLENESLKLTLIELDKELVEVKQELSAQTELYNKEIPNIDSLRENCTQLTSENETFKTTNDNILKELNNLKTQAKLNEDKANENIQKLQSEESSHKAEIDKLTAQLLILTTNSTKAASELEQHSDEIGKLLHTKEQENIQLNNQAVNLKIELKALQEEYDSISSQMVILKESLIQKDIDMKDIDESHKKDIQELSNIKEEYQELTNKLSQAKSSSVELEKLTIILNEKDAELISFKNLNDKLIQANQELSNKVNLESIEIQKESKANEDIDENQTYDKDEYMSLVMKNDYLNELVKEKEAEINKLLKENENYKSEVAKAMSTEENPNKIRESSSFGTSFTQNDDVGKLQETLTKIKKAYKEKHNELCMVQQQLSLLKGDIKNYQSKLDKIEKEGLPIKDYVNFKLKLMIILNNYKPKKKEHIELVKEIKNELGEEARDSKDKKPDDQSSDKKKGFFDFMKK